MLAALDGAFADEACAVCTDACRMSGALAHTILFIVFGLWLDSGKDFLAAINLSPVVSAALGI
jgi:hypothetical protein